MATETDPAARAKQLAELPVLGMAEASEIIKVTKSNFAAHRERFSEEGQCPAPTCRIAAGPVWAGKDATQLRKWAEKFNKNRPGRGARPKVKPTDLAEAKAVVAKKAAPKAAPVKATTKKAAPPAKVKASKKAAPVEKSVVPDLPLETTIAAPPAKKVRAAAKPKATVPATSGDNVVRGLFGNRKVKEASV